MARLFNARVAGASLGALLMVFVLAPSSGAAKFAARTCTVKNKVTTCVFSYTGHPVKWVVPTGVTGVTGVTGNTGEATAPTGSIYGGGVFNGQVFKDLTPVLTLRSSTISANTIKAGKGTSVEGGGVYSKGFRIVREQSVIQGNKPDQCAGC